MINKDTFRIVVVIIFTIILTLKISDFYDLLSGSIVLILLVFDVFEQNHNNNLKSELIYYLSWVIIGLLISYNRKSYIVPYIPIFTITIIKTLTIILSLLRHKEILVTRTMLSKLSLITIAIYFMELLVNSTHGFGSIAVLCTKAAAIEFMIILFIEKNRLAYKSSLLNYFRK